LKIGGLREIKDILRNFGLGLSKEQLMNMYDYATAEKLSCLFIDLEEKDKQKKFRKGIHEFLDPEIFGSDEEI